MITDDQVKEKIKKDILKYLKAYGDTLPSELANKIPDVGGIFLLEETCNSNRALWRFTNEAIEAAHELVEEGEIKIDTKMDILLKPKEMLPMRLAGKQKKYVKPRFVKSIFRLIKEQK